MEPLLPFPTPEKIAPESNAGRGIEKPLRFPPLSTRTTWFKDRFTQLKKSLLGAEVSSDASINESEKVLVIETKGDCANFITAVNNLPDMSFLKSQLSGYVEATEEYYFEDPEKGKLEKKIPLNMYLSMANQRSVDQLEKLWRDYSANDDFKFPRGLTGLRDVFNLLEDIRFWGIEDRLRHFEQPDDWAFKQEYQSNQLFPVEIDIWFSHSKEVSARREKELIALLTESKAKVLSCSYIPEIEYHAICAEIAPADIDGFLSGQTSQPEYITYDGLMLLNILGQCAVKQPDLSETNEEVREPKNKSLLNTPIAAVIDGLPLEGHTLIDDRITVYDIFNVRESYQAFEKFHGTSVASAIIHGDLSSSNESIKSKLAVVPVLSPASSNTIERTLYGQLPVQLIYEALNQLLKSEKGKHIRVINLSLGDEFRYFENSASPWARLIDWASHAFGVLVIVSAGNIRKPLVFNETPGSSFASIDDLLLEEKTIRAVHRDQQHRKLMSPAETVNGITVGAINDDASTYIEDYSGPRDLFHTPNMPSAINPISSGINKSVKPELMLPGGRQLYEEGNPIDNQMALDVVNSLKEPGIKVAIPSKLQGHITNVGYVTGTSFAAALATHQAIKLSQILDEQFKIDRKYYGVLLKSLLVHGSEYNPETMAIASSSLESQFSKKVQIPKHLKHHYWGYGMTNTHRVQGCTLEQATLIHTGEIPINTSLKFLFPKPECLHTVSGTWERRVIATLAWFSRTNPGNAQKYRRTRLEWSLTKSQTQIDKLGIKDRAFDNNRIKNGTVLHEVFSGTNTAIVESNDMLEIVVSAKDASSMPELYNVQFALVVTIDALGSGLPIYQNVDTKVKAMAKGKVF